MVPEGKRYGNFMKNRDIHGGSNVWSTAQRLKRSMDLMLVLGMNGTMDVLAMANSLHWNSHVLWREKSRVLRRALGFEVEGQRMKGRPKRTWTRQVEEYEGWFCTLSIMVDCWR